MDSDQGKQEDTARLESYFFSRRSFGGELENVPGQVDLLQLLLERDEEKDRVQVSLRQVVPV